MNILDYKLEDLQIDKQWTEILGLFSEDDKVVCVCRTVKYGHIEMLTLTTDGRGVHSRDKIITLKKPPFVFPSGIGEAVGKAFRTKSGAKTVVYGDFRFIDKNDTYPINTNNGTYTASGILTLEEPTKYDIVDYWEEK